MPIYEYQCNACNGHFEIVQKFSDKPKRKCESCGGKLTKLLSASAFHLKGSGWYASDYAAKPADKKDSGDSCAADATSTPKPDCANCPSQKS